MVSDSWFLKELDLGSFGISVSLDIEWIPYTGQLTYQM
jgi:hypothetical protein